MIMSVGGMLGEESEVLKENLPRAALCTTNSTRPDPGKNKQ
jgi:hypothetical protein